MPKRISVPDVLTALDAGGFDDLIGAIEDQQIEFKGAPYQLSSDAAKAELAKDVSALANAQGGVIVIGFRTEKDAATAVEYVDSCRPFDPSLFDQDQYRKILQDWIFPPIHSLDFRCYTSAPLHGKAVAAIVVPPNVSESKPHIVTRVADEGGKVRGTLIGYYERVQAAIPPTSPETLRGYLKDGVRFAELKQRLDSIEEFLGNRTKPIKSGPDEVEVRKRITEATAAAERKDRPNVVLAATSTSQCTFPDLFRSRSSQVVKLLEDPPVLRRDGFAITLKGWDRPSEIIRGRLRRVVARQAKLTELWEDGLLLALGQGDDDLLCWFMRNLRNPQAGLPIRNFVLAEVVLNFCNLAVGLFKHAQPAPEGLRFLLSLENMTDQGVPCTLSSAPDNGPIFGWGGGARTAPDALISTSFVTPFDQIDAGVVTFQLLAGLYVEFGFDHDDVPYVQRDQDANRITPHSLFPNWQA